MDGRAFRLRVRQDLVLESCDPTVDPQHESQQTVRDGRVRDARDHAGGIGWRKGLGDDSISSGGGEMLRDLVLRVVCTEYGGVAG